MAESNPSVPGNIVEGTQNISPRRIGMSIGAIVSALLASLCCIGPVLFVTVGVGAGLATWFEPLRPVFTVLTVALMAVGFYSVYGRSAARTEESCEEGATCTPRSASRTRDKLVLWSATLIALMLLTFPQWSLWIL
jgi:mercuric ion transport protein